MIKLLGIIAHYGRYVLICGLVTGILFPALSLALKPAIPVLASTLILIAAFRIGWREAAGGFAQIKGLAAYILGFQVAVPIAFVLITQALGWSGPTITAITLLLCGPAISGAPNLVILSGGNPATALRLVVVGTALLPLTIIPAMSLSTAFGDGSDITQASLRLLAIILVTASIGFGLRALIAPKALPERLRNAADGLGALNMGVLVISLMVAFGPALLSRPADVAWIMLAALTVNYGLQITTGFLMPESGERMSQAISAGNRNMALFLAALPSAMTDPLLLFIACYQIPMYLTPMILGRFHRR